MAVLALLVKEIYLWEVYFCNISIIESILFQNVCIFINTLSFLVRMGYYDEIASGYEELHEEEQGKKIKFIQEHFSVASDEKLLDVGCGTGLTTEPWNCIRYGADPAPKLLERARSKDSITYVEAAAEKLPFSNGFFDVVISITAIQNYADIEKGLSEIKRVGKERFVLTFLKKSAKKDLIDGLIRGMFEVSEVLEEEKDMVYIVEKANI